MNLEVVSQSIVHFEGPCPAAFDSSWLRFHLATKADLWNPVPEWELTDQVFRSAMLEGKGQQANFTKSG